MQVNEEIRKELVKNFRRWLGVLFNRMYFYIEQIEKAKTVEDVMRYKKELLYAYVRDMPLTADLCYFCLLYEDKELQKCDDCEYGKIHGICFDSDSDYQKVLKKRSELLNEIDFSYFNDDKYK